MKWLTSWGYLVFGPIGVISGIVLIWLCLADGGENLWVRWRAGVAVPLGLWAFFKGWQNLKIDRDAELEKDENG